MDRETSQRAFAAVTLITVVSVALVLVVYAILLGTITGGNVVIGGASSVSGTMYYSADNSTWTTTLDVTDPASTWYAKVTTDTNGYKGPVTIDWQLQRKNGPSSWENVGSAIPTSSVTLDGTAQTLYTSGLSAVGNHDWKTEVASTPGTYHVVATFNNA
jgi:hypothetical protein